MMIEDEAIDSKTKERKKFVSKWLYYAINRTEKFNK
jgi:hypothetical protein